MLGMLKEEGSVAENLGAVCHVVSILAEVLDVKIKRSEEVTITTAGEIN